MTKEITFCSLRGRIYTAAEVKVLVKRRLRARWRSFLITDWHERLNVAFSDEQWLRWRNGQTPGALVNDLDLVVTIGAPHA